MRRGPVHTSLHVHCSGQVAARSTWRRGPVIVPAPARTCGTAHPCTAAVPAPARPAPVRRYNKDGLSANTTADLQHWVDQESRREHDQAEKALRLLVS